MVELVFYLPFLYSCLVFVFRILSPLVLLPKYFTLFLIKAYKVSSCVFLAPANKNPQKKEKKNINSLGTWPET